MNKTTAQQLLAVVWRQKLSEAGRSACCVMMEVAGCAVFVGRDEMSLQCRFWIESDRAGIGRIIECGIDHALVAERKVMVFFILLRLVLRVCPVRNRVHGSTLLAEAKHGNEGKNQQQAAQHKL